ncbi:MAG: DUF4230 domain-containing protein [Phycisphaeraceae bacterium]|nr:MAG: DUF4230 domain-containing protein [Phycisphaeraceae bacterium]
MGDALLFMFAGLVVGGVIIGAIAVLLRRKGDGAPLREVRSEMLAEKVRTVGKLVGLEVHAKEITTSTKGWAWLPPILLSQAKIAMIFSYEKQYFVDLRRIRARDVEEIGPGRFRMSVPPVEGTLRLSDVSPYDIQAGRILGLLDVIQMNAKTQRELMDEARYQATALFEKNDERYLNEAKRSITNQIGALLSLFEVQVEVVWSDEARSAVTGEMSVEPEVTRKLTGV